MMCNIDRLYSKLAFALQPDDIFRADNIAYGPMQQNGDLGVFDEVDGHFYTIDGWNLTQSSFSQLAVEFPFQTKGCVCVGSGCSKNQQLGFLLKDPAGVYRVCLIDVTGNVNTASSFTVTGPEMDRIIKVAFCDNCELMYYITEESIYATILAAGRVSTRKVNWSPDSPDEKITGITQYKQAWYGVRSYSVNDYPFQLPTNRLQLIITTYNETTGEGKIYLRPFNVSTGLFTAQNNGTYGGFGEITAICPTFK